MGSMVLHFNPSAAQTAATGVDHVTRSDGIYTLHMVDGSTRAARLRNPDDRDVMAIIAAVKDDGAGCASATMTSGAHADRAPNGKAETLPGAPASESTARPQAGSGRSQVPAGDVQLALF